jgi:hypothetical protein
MRYLMQLHQDACHQDAWLARIVQSRFSLNRYTKVNNQIAWT